MLAWCFEDERPKNHQALLKRLVAGGMSAPAHWPLELSNIIWNGERRGRLSSADAARFIVTVESLRVSIDFETPRRAWSDILALARADGLTAYDAAYLELAVRRQATLVSKDADLLKAAKHRGVATLSVLS